MWALSSETVLYGRARKLGSELPGSQGSEGTVMPT